MILRASILLSSVLFPCTAALAFDGAEERINEVFEFGRCTAVITIDPRTTGIFGQSASVRVTPPNDYSFYAGGSVYQKGIAAREALDMKPSSIEQRCFGAFGEGVGNDVQVTVLRQVGALDASNGDTFDGGEYIGVVFRITVDGRAYDLEYGISGVTNTEIIASGNFQPDL